MSNGNIYVNASGGQGGAGLMYEVDPTGNIVWGPHSALGSNNGSQKGFRYECDYPGIIALEPYMYSNGNITSTCFEVNSINDMSSILQIFPNPTNNTCNIQFESSLYSKITVEVYNTLGQEIFNQEVFGSSGQFRQEINLENHAEGVYVIHITSDQGQFYTDRISHIK